MLFESKRLRVQLPSEQAEFPVVVALVITPCKDLSREKDGFLDAQGSEALLVEPHDLPLLKARLELQLEETKAQLAEIEAAEHALKEHCAPEPGDGGSAAE